MLDDTYLVTEHLNVVATSEIETVLSILGHEPVGYVDYLRRFGTGTYCDYLTVAARADKLTELTNDFREIESQYVDWIPSYGPGIRFDDAHCIGLSIDGDYFVSTPGRPIHVFPRHDDSLYVLNEGLLNPLALTRIDEPNRPYACDPPFRYFESDLDRNSVSLFTAGQHQIHTVRDTIAEMLPSGPIRQFVEESDDDAEDWLILMFPRTIQGRIQLTQCSGDARVGIRVSFDRHYREHVDTLIEHLEREGFYVTYRHG